VIPPPPKPAFDAKNPAPYWIAAAQSYNALIGCGAPVPMTVGTMANLDMEAAFKTYLIGDHDTAFNMVQWHWSPRGERILARTGIDVRTERSIKRVVGALWWELNNVYPKQLVMLKAFNLCRMAARYFCTQIEGAGAKDAADRREADAEILDVWVAENRDFIASHPAQ
jgi:hypothetical protein